jgi:hypothetical protein
MTTQVIINLPDDVYRQAERFAKLANCDIATILANTIEHSIPSLRPETETLPQISDLADEEVLAIAQLQMPLEEDQRLSELLDRQQSGQLTENEHRELNALMQTYQEGLLRKATALKEAVNRGLMNPLDS